MRRSHLEPDFRRVQREGDQVRHTSSGPGSEELDGGGRGQAVCAPDSHHDTGYRLPFTDWDQESCVCVCVCVCGRRVGTLPGYSEHQEIAYRATC